jgi:hypothetical protein
MENDFMQSLKWSELAEIEDYMGLAMDEWTNSNAKAKLTFAMQYLMAKRKKPDLTIKVAEDMTIKQLSELAGVEINPKEVKVS